MIHIKYIVKESGVHGIGLFTEQMIQKGELIYTPSPLLDLDLTVQDFLTLTDSEKEEVRYYGYFNKKHKKWHVAFDMIRILNHGAGSAANVTQDDDMILIAKRCILKGEELLQDYAEIYPKDGDHFSRIET